MFKALLILASLLLILSPLQATADVSQDAITSAEASSVLVDAKFLAIGKMVENDSGTYCSGFVGASTGTTEYVVTAGHCQGLTTDESPDHMGILQVTRVTFYDGDVGKVVKVHKLHGIDMAVLKVVSDHPHPPVGFQSSLERGRAVLALGYSNGYRWILDTGVEATGSDTEEDDQVMVECHTCQPGVSGAAFFDSEGNVIGMVVAIDMKGFAFVVPSTDIMKGLTGLIK